MNSRRSSTLNVLNPKSSVLCPSTNHITSQFLALEQVKAHQNMLSRAKGSVDTSPPKSLQSYLNNINQKKKRLWQDQESPFRERSSFFDRTSPNSAYFRRTVKDVDTTKDFIDHLDEGTSLNKSIQTAIPFPQCNSSTVADKISWYLEAVNHGDFPEHAKGSQHLSKSKHQLHTGSTGSLSSSLRSGRVVKGDIMDWHKKSFTSRKQFSPQILANNPSKSKVLGMRCYNSPRRKNKGNSINSSDTFDSFEDDDDNDNNEQSHEEEGNTNEEDDINDEGEDNDVEEEIDKSTKDKIDEVPIKPDINHHKWLSDQALRAQLRHNLRARPTSSKQKINSPLRAYHFKDKINSFKFNTVSRDEEEKYLKFFSDVTEDILRSGIYTDSAIERSFQFHLQFFPKDADQGELQQLLAQVLSSLQLPIENSDEHNSIRHSPIPHSKEGTDFIMNVLNHVKITNDEHLPRNSNIDAPVQSVAEGGANAAEIIEPMLPNSEDTKIL